MKKNILISLLILLSINSQSFSQKKDTLTNSFSIKHIAIPVSLIAIGISQSGNNSKMIQNNIVENYPLLKSSLDDYAQYVPVTFYLLQGSLGLKPQHDFKSRFIYTAISYGTMAFTVEILKRVVQEQRPDLSDHYSFPSGHTATAFTGAELFHQELKNSHPILSYAAFPIAAAVGTFRMLNNKHYLSDVLVGAGIGILSAKLAYGIYHPKATLKESKLSLNFSPTKVMGQNGFTISGRF